jgi:hypothetical protein
MDHDPTQDLGAATKQYVDTEIAANATPPADPVNSIQYNNAGVFGGRGALTWDNTVPELTMTNATLNIKSSTFSWMGLYKTDGNSNYIMGYDGTSGNLRWGIM